MKLSVKPELMKLLTLTAGTLGLMLRVVLFATGFDEKGLLISGHWAGKGLWILTAAMVAAIFLLTRTIHGSKRYFEAHPASFGACLGAVLAAFAIGRTAIQELGTQSLLVTVPGFAAAAALLVIAFCRVQPSRPNFLLHVIVCVFFATRMVNQYQSWNSDPQILDFAFYLGAYIALMLTAYQHAAFDAGMGNHRTLWCFSLLAVFLCCVSLTTSADTWLLLGCGIWSFTNVTNLKPRGQMHTPSREEV